MKPKSNVDKEIYQAPTIKESIAAAVKTAMSETPQEETDLMLLQEALQEEDYKKWKRKNPGGSFKYYLKEFKPKRIKLSNGGLAEDYADLIDAYEKGIDVMDGESLTQYIKRIKASERKD